jgi:sugar phosphate isomerase/epimerase
MAFVSRRQLLYLGAAVSVVNALRPRWADAMPRNLPLGIQLYTVADTLQRDVPGTLKHLRSIGYRHVETAGFLGLTAMEFRHEIDAADLQCHSAHLVFNRNDPDPLFEDAHALGAHYVVSSAMLSQRAASASGPTADDYKQMAQRLNDLGKRAKQAGLDYAYHNHNVEFRQLEDGGIGYDVLLTSTDPDLVAFELDCGWMVSAGFNPVEYFRKHPHRFRMLHIKDFVKGSNISTSLTEDRPQGTELGRGYIDCKPILMAADQAGIHDYYVEQEPPFLDMTSLEAAKVDYDYLHAVTG